MSNPIKINNHYMRVPDEWAMINALSALDCAVEDGFILEHKAQTEWAWKNCELLRRYNWGQIHMTWSPDRGNPCVEKGIKDLISTLDAAMLQTTPMIYMMRLNTAPSEKEMLSQQLLG